MSTFKLLGQRVLLTRPLKKDLGIQLTPELESELMREEVKNYSKLTVFAVGDDVTNISIGDEVYVAPNTLIYAEVLTIESQERIMVRTMDISLIW